MSPLTLSRLKRPADAKHVAFNYNKGKRPANEEHVATITRLKRPAEMRKISPISLTRVQRCGTYRKKNWNLILINCFFVLVIN